VLDATSTMAHRGAWVARGLLAAARPRQWIKNLFVFAALVFAGKLDDGSSFAEAIVCFAAFCAASSAAYLLNDVVDAESDRTHPVKCRRPIAAGIVAPRLALTASATLAGLAIAAAFALDLGVGAYVCAFLAIQIAYSARLKHVALLDVMVIAGLFVLRAAAGAQAIGVPSSDWLLVCTAMIALFLGFAKRRGELLLVRGDRTPGRAVLDDYSLALVDQLLAIVAGGTIIAYTLYTIEAVKHSFLATVPFVVFGVFRYLLLVHKEDLGEEPERVLLGDRQIILTVLGWVVVAAILKLR
jgi:4-hydroxybenzoate polyprenyltransferase